MKRVANKEGLPKGQIAIFPAVFLRARVGWLWRGTHLGVALVLELDEGKPGRVAGDPHILAQAGGEDGGEV